MVIDFSRLAKTTPTPSADIGSPSAAKPLAPIEVSFKNHYEAVDTANGNFEMLFHN